MGVVGAPDPRYIPSPTLFVGEFGVSKVRSAQPFHSHCYKFNSLVTHIDNYTNLPLRAQVGWACFGHSTNSQFL